MLLEIKDLVKEYRNGVRANDGISLSVGEGEVFGLLGPNGAGKSTLVNQIIGLLGPRSGEITIDRVDVVKDPNQRFTGDRVYCCRSMVCLGARASLQSRDET